MKKKMLSLLLTLAMVLGMLPLPALAADEITVNVTIAVENEVQLDKEGKTALISAPVTLNAADSPTVVDALKEAHALYHEDGAEGYSESSNFFSTFWGETTYNVGYFQDGQMVMAPTALTGGEDIEGFIYKNYAADVYARFDRLTASVQAGEEVTLTLCGEPIYDLMMESTPPAPTSPVAGAAILVGDSTSAYIPYDDSGGWATDDNGQVTLRFSTAGSYVISARNEDDTLMPPHCVVTVTESISGETQAQTVAADKAALSIAYAGGDSIALPSAGASGQSRITWASSAPAVISTSGAVVKQLTQQEVTLTATITCGAASDTKAFPITIPAFTQAEYQALENEIDAALDSAVIRLTNDAGPVADLSAVTQTLHLPDISGYNTVWISEHSGIAAPVDQTGPAAVTRIASDVTGDLILTLTKSGVARSKPFSVTVKGVTAQEVMDNIAARYAKTGIASDANAPWLAADMAAYAAAFPNTENILSAEQKQAYLDILIPAADAATRPADLAKYIIALRAMGYDGRKVVTSDLREVDVVQKLTDLVDGRSPEVTNIYTLPYVLIALRQGEGYATQAQMDYLVAAALSSKSSWQSTTWGTDGATPMLLALAPYCDGSAAVKAAVDETVPLVKAKQDGETGGIGNASSTGLAMAAFAALGKDPAAIAGESGKSLVDGLMRCLAHSLDAFEPTANTFATEQGFRGLAALALYNVNGAAAQVYDFSAQPMNTAEASWSVAGCPVAFHVVPGNAVVELKLSDIVQIPAANGKYDLAEGEYSYSVSADGYTTQTGRITVSAQDAANHAAKEISVSLSTAPTPERRDITVSVAVKMHPTGGAVADGRYTYKNNSGAYTDLAAATVTLKSGATIFDALDAALSQAGIGYTEKTYGYISSINGIAELDYGPDSGWMYMVNGTTSTVGCRDKNLTADASMVWFYTDDYTAELGSENWTGGGAKLPEKDVPLDPALPFTDVEGHWAYDAISHAYQSGLMAGTGDTLFSPDATLNRAMLVTILYQMEKTPAVTAANPFADVAAGDWYTGAVIWASENAIVSGVGDGKFTPTANMTREQLATMLYSYAKYKGYDVSAGGDADMLSYDDAGSISQWAIPAIQWSCAAGLITGRTATTIDPDGAATRAEAATILARFFEKVAK